jgi:enoyl-CoA hydratase/carnithine racemase
LTDPRLVLDIDGPVARLTIARAEKLNALDAEMVEGLVPLCRRGERSAGRVLAITGRGERSFSAGADIAAWGG